MKRRHHRHACLVAALVGPMVGGLADLALAQSPAGRVGAPTEAPCARDHLTLYAGRVTTLRHDARRTVIRIATDEHTTESVTVAHPTPDEATRRFRLDGGPFTAADWRRVVDASGRARPGLRVAAWVCDDGSPPLVDWQPPRKP